ncbi:MAG: 1-acyl-sn-glycerol-3-phosphate acyltransferase [Lentisphaerae bacterium]|nr:1-acyl-sn-glycerol-3-phosphate acyltransferase [Lentisphaerota bacterium]
MTVDQFHEGLRREGQYETPAAERPAVPVRAGWRATWRFSWREVGTIWAAMRLNRRGLFDTAGWARVVFDTWREAEKMGAVITVEGFDALRDVRGPVVYAANHMSMLETLLLPAALLAHSPLSIVLKRSLLSYPVFGAPLRRIQPITVTRRSARDDLRTVLETGRLRLEAGRSVLLFPQATRRSVFQAEQFNSMGDKLARAAGVPLVPVALKTDFQGIGRVLKDFGMVDPARPIRFALGPALSDTLAKGERHRRCVAFIEERLRAWGMPVAAKGETE